jgi:hypothetical protein
MIDQKRMRPTLAQSSSHLTALNEASTNDDEFVEDDM